MAGKHAGSADYVAALSHAQANPFSKENKAFAEGMADKGRNNPHPAGTPASNAWLAGAAATEPEEVTNLVTHGEIPLTMADKPLTTEANWTVGGTASVGSGIATIPAAGTLTDVVATLTAGMAYYVTHGGIAAGTINCTIADGNATLVSNTAQTIVIAGATTASGILLEQNAGTPVMTANFQVIEIQPIAVAIHPDKMNGGGLFPNGIYDASAADGGFPVWAGDSTVEILTSIAANGTAAIEPSSNGNFGIIGIVPGLTYAMGWAAIANPSNTSFQVDLGGVSVEGNFGTPANVNIVGGGAGPVSPVNAKWAGDSNAAGGQDGQVKFTGPMTITWVPT